MKMMLGTGAATNSLDDIPEVQLIDFDAAVQEALGKTHPDRIERVWVDGGQEAKSVKHEGCFIVQRVSVLAENHPENRVVESRHTRFGDMWF